MMPNIERFVYGAYLYPALWASKHVSPGTNVLDEDWDALIILDACRVDALRSVADEYDFIQNVESRWSVGSTSKEWLLNTFTVDRRNEVNKMGMVTGNAWAEMIFERSPNWGQWTALSGSIWEGHPLSKIVAREVVSAADFHSYLPVWDKDGRDIGNSAPRAEPITDAAIKISRERQPERLLVHYMQPHEPFFHETASDEVLSEKDAKPLEMATNGDYCQNELWEDYLDNLRYVLDSVDILLKNMDAEKVVITADHGELLGELGQYGHVAALPHPDLRKVPWVVTDASDTGDYSSSRDLDDIEQSSGDVKERLSDLGYI